MMKDAGLIDEIAIDELPSHLSDIKHFEDSKIKNEVINKIQQYALDNALKRNSKKDVIEKIQKFTGEKFIRNQ